LFGALGTNIGTLTDKKYECLQKLLTTSNIVQKKLIEVVNNQEKAIYQSSQSLELYSNLFDYLVVLNPANLETAHRVKAEIHRIQYVFK
jgi:hypothetical protein